MLFDQCKSARLEDSRKKRTISVFAPILEDIFGNTIFDSAFDKGGETSALANVLLNGIEDYPFLSHGFVLVSGVIKAFEMQCPDIGKFLDKRFVQS